MTTSTTCQAAMCQRPATVTMDGDQFCRFCAEDVAHVEAANARRDRRAARRAS